MNERGRDERPIGFWLKRADQAISARANAALSSLRLTRTHWQVLALVEASGAASAEVLERELRDFADPAQLQAILGSLQARGWLARGVSPDGAPTFALSEAGRRGHADALALQGEVRQRSVRGISPEDYLTAIRVLETVVANLE